MHSFQDHPDDLHGKNGKKCPDEDSFKTIHQKSGKSVLSRPSTKCAKNVPKSGSFKTIKSPNVHKKGSFKTIEDGSKNNTSFKTISENDQKSTTLKIIANRVQNLNPWYMVPVDEASQVISDPKSRKKAQPVTEQPSSGPPSPGFKIQPHLHGARISVHQQYQGSSSIVPQQLWLHWRHAGWVQHQDRPNHPTSPAQKAENSHWVQGGDQEGASRDGLARNHHQADWAHTMGQQPDIPQKGKWQVEDMTWPQGLEQGNHLWESQSPNPRGDSSCPHRSHQILQGRWQQSLLWDAPYRGSLTPHNVQHPPQKLQIPMCPLWTKMSQDIFQMRMDNTVAQCPSLQKYDLVIMYWPGKEMLLADALSRLLSRTNTEIKLDMTDYIKWCLTCIKCSNLPVKTLKPHEVPPGPWVKIGVDFFQDHLAKKHLIIADYFSKFPYMFPVASAHHFKTITHLRELFMAEGIPAVVMSDNRPPFNGEEFRQFAHDFDFVHTSSLHLYQSNGFIEAIVKKVKNAYMKMDRSPNAQARALLQLHDTPIMADLPSPAEILHGHPAQGAVLSRPSKRVNIHQIRQRLIELQEKQKEHFDKAHRVKDLCVLKVKEQVWFFHNKQGTGPIKWTTGTVTEILECGWSYMIQGLNSRVYRKNRADLKPICHDGTSFQDHPVKTGKKQPKDISFQDHQPSKAKSMSFQKETSYMDTRSMLFDEPDTHQTPPSSPPRCYSPRSPSCSPLALFPSRESSVEPSSGDSSPEGRKRHKSKPAFIWPCDIDQGLSHGLSALLAEMPPLAPYRIQRQAKAKAQEKISTHKWLLSRPFETDTVNLASNWLISRPLCIRNRIGCFQDHLRHTWWIITSMDHFDFFQDHHIQNTVVKPPWTILTPFKTIWRRKVWTYVKIKEDRQQRTQWQTHPSSSFAP